eukprot:TRINITY_DN347_c0_g1_i1.p1 TRINITY_DN347_c0_g1~~TRINITY_DN347_c0_g1_i1.p1  ORF type:complete len:348 (-),score=71.65 TRINITY_DN347_c0_g1_i1:141-1100(-)
MQDRLKELQKGNPDAYSSNKDDGDIELGETKGKKASVVVGADGDEEAFMVEFFEEVGRVKGEMAVIRRLVKQIEEKSVQQLNSINSDPNSKGGNEIQHMIDETNTKVQQVRKQLENMKITKESEGSATELRIRANMHGTLTNKFLEIAQEYQEVQTNYKNRYKEKIERQYKIAKPDASHEEIEEAIESGDSSKVFANQILDTHLHQQAKNALAYIEARHRDIKQIESSIQELHQLFIDFAVLVESQGELLNQIEYNVTSSVAYTAKGADELRGAVKQAKRSRKKMCIIIIICIIIIAVILGPTLGSLLKSSGGSNPSNG